MAPSQPGFVLDPLPPRIELFLPIIASRPESPVTMLVGHDSATELK
jgi:hypothetical protein